jgi:hypothetical protein
VKRATCFLTCLGISAVGAIPAVAGTNGRSARVVGRIERCGALPGCGPTNARVTIRNSDGHQVAAERTKHARFAFTVLPGRYTIVATLDGDHTGRPVHLTANNTTRANITFALK